MDNANYIRKLAPIPLTNKRKRKLLIALLIGIVSLTAILSLRATAIPFRAVDTSAYWAQRGFEQVSETLKYSNLIRRARLDFMVAPVGRRDQLRLWFIYRRGGELHVLFRFASSSGTAIVYVFDARDHKPLWKTEVGYD